MPILEVFPSRSEMDRRAHALKQSGAVVLPDDQPEEGVLAYAVFPVGSGPSKLVHYPHGRQLVPEVRLVESVVEFATWLREHEGHPRFRSNALRAKQIGVVCFCHAHEGRSQVIRIPVEKTRHADSSIMSEILRVSSV